MSPLLVLLPRIGCLHYFEIKIAKNCKLELPIRMVEIFLKSPNVKSTMKDALCSSPSLNSPIKPVHFESFWPTNPNRGGGT